MNFDDIVNACYEIKNIKTNVASLLQILKRFYIIKEWYKKDNLFYINFNNNYYKIIKDNNYDRN